MKDIDIEHLLRDAIKEELELNKKLDPPPMWDHYCVSEGTNLSVGKDEPCNWCGKYQDDVSEFGKLGKPIEL
jgi:hypothetical protein